jgi:hypothetical protein
LGGFAQGFGPTGCQIDAGGQRVRECVPDDKLGNGRAQLHENPTGTPVQISIGLVRQPF